MDADLDALIYDFCAAAETIGAALLVYLIFACKVRMSRYRFYVLHNVVWCYLFSLNCFLWKPMYAFPASCVVFRPIVALPNAAFPYLFAVLKVCKVNMELGVVFSILYRYSQAFVGWFNRLFQRTAVALLPMTLLTAYCYLKILVPFFMGVLTDGAEARAELLRQLPAWRAHVDQLRFVCVRKTEKVARVTEGMALMFGVYFVWGIVVYAHLYVKIYHQRCHRVYETRTARLHVVLFKALGVQLLVSYTLLLLPNALIMAAYFTQRAEGASVARLCLTLMALHGCVDYLTMVYFITPYRLLLWRQVRCWTRLGTANVSTLPHLTDSDTKSRRWLSAAA